MAKIRLFIVRQFIVRQLRTKYYDRENLFLTFVGLLPLGKIHVNIQNIEITLI